jgi:hypothetical protein
MSKNNGRGPPKGSQNHFKHGVVALKNAIKRRTRRGRSLIDRRSAAGKHAVAMRDELIADQGGTDNLSVAKLALIEMVARDVYFLDECDKRIMRWLHTVIPAEEAKVIQKGRLAYGLRKHPRQIATMYGYRSSVAKNLASNLLALGLEKVKPPPKTLEQLLSEDDEETEGGPA